jgi:hypothetical protein
MFANSCAAELLVKISRGQVRSGAQERRESVRDKAGGGNGGSKAPRLKPPCFFYAGAASVMQRHNRPNLREVGV